MRSRWLLGVVVAGATAALTSGFVAACGDRTALDLESPAPRASSEGGPGEAGMADLVVLPEARDTLDSPTDEGADVPDVPVPNDCPDAAATLIYVITQEDELYGFYPPTRAFHDIGRVTCLGSSGAFSMAVDRKGIAYVLDFSGGLHRVHTGTAECEPVPYLPGQHGFTHFGMGYATDPTTDGGVTTETLYVEGDPYFGAGGAEGLARIDTTTWTLTAIGRNHPPLNGGELTGTGAASLYSLFWYGSDSHGSRVGQIDTSTGEVIHDVHLASPDLAGAGASFAVAYWGGSFYLFNNSNVNEYTPTDAGAPSAPLVATLSGGSLIVGAGVSTCAPQ